MYAFAMYICIMLIQSTMYNVFILNHTTQLQYHLSLILLLTLHVIQIRKSL